MATLNPVLTKFPSVPWFGTSAFVEGFEIAITSATTFTVEAGGARNQTNDFTIQWPTVQPNVPGDITVDITTVGANGCFPLPLSSVVTTNTTFPVYIMGDSAGNQNHNSAVVVATADNFLLPGYDSFRRIGTVYIANGSNTLIPMTQYGHFEHRRYQLANNLAALTGGVATTATAIVLDATVLPVPSYATEVYGDVSFTPATAGDFVSITDTALSSSAFITIGSSAVAAMAVPFTISPALVSGDPTIYYFNSAAAGSTDILISGWGEDLAIHV